MTAPPQNPPSSFPPAPLVYLPGASGTAACLGVVAGILAPRRPPLLVNYPGLSGPDIDPPVGDVDDLVTHLLRTLPSRFDLVAISLGSAVALRLALEAPRRLRRMVLLAPTGGIDTARFGGAEFRSAVRAARPDAPTWLLDDTDDLSGRLSEIETPTLLVTGDADPICPVTVADFLGARLPHARVEVLAGATHDLESEQPDVVASVIEVHLRGRRD
ncbi:MAG: alpha/beta fold hydrolase [Deltaproteobacteria bacterium]|nr:alpha/beta fold hydrolase [Deltaproteobacteria bacterium]